MIRSSTLLLVCLDKLAFGGAVWCGGNWLVGTVHMGRTGRNFRMGIYWDRGTNGSGLISGLPPFYLEVKWVTGIGDCYHFYWRFWGCRVFLVHKNNNNTLHTNPNYQIVQDITNNMYDLIILKNTTNHANNENIIKK